MNCVFGVSFGCWWLDSTAVAVRMGCGKERWNYYRFHQLYCMNCCLWSYFSTWDSSKVKCNFSSIFWIHFSYLKLQKVPQNSFTIATAMQIGNWPYFPPSPTHSALAKFHFELLKAVSTTTTPSSRTTGAHQLTVTSYYWILTLATLEY